MLSRCMVVHRDGGGYAAKFQKNQRIMLLFIYFFCTFAVIRIELTNTAKNFYFISTINNIIV
jgi:hypothetical protein